MKFEDKLFVFQAKAFLKENLNVMHEEELCWSKKGGLTDMILIVGSLYCYLGKNKTNKQKLTGGQGSGF